MSHFDDRAATWDDDPTHTERARAVVDALRERLDLGSGTTVLEVGAGTGGIGRALAPDVASVVLLDDSEGMTTVARQRIQEAGLTNVTAIQGDVDHGFDGTFDLVVASLMLHHVHDVSATVARFAALVREGGHVAIADLDEDVTREFHDEGFAGHHGFDRAALARDLDAAGLVDAQWDTVYEMPKTTASGHERIFPMFLVTARRGTSKS